MCTLLLVQGCFQKKLNLQQGNVDETTVLRWQQDLK